MSTVYHYDKNGNLTGSTSDEEPKQGSGLIIGFIAFIIFILYALFGNSKPGKDKATSEPTQQEVISQESPDNSIKSEPTGRTMTTRTVTREGSVHGDRLDANPALQDQLRKMEELKRKARARDENL